MTTADLKKDLASQEALRHECMTAAREFQDTVNAREATIGALAAAKKAIDDIHDSFVQLASRTKKSVGVDSVDIQVLHLLRKLATKTKSPALSQLTSRMSSALRLGSGSGG